MLTLLREVSLMAISSRCGSSKLLKRNSTDSVKVKEAKLVISNSLTTTLGLSIFCMREVMPSNGKIGKKSTILTERLLREQELKQLLPKTKSII